MAAEAFKEAKTKLFVLKEAEQMLKRAKHKLKPLEQTLQSSKTKTSRTVAIS